MNYGHPVIWWLVILMALAGIASHWLKQIIMLKKTGGDMKQISFREYWGTNWPESLLCVFSTVGGIAFFYESNMLTHAMAYAIGFMGNSTADMLGGRVQAMVNSVPVQPKAKE